MSLKHDNYIKNKNNKKNLKGIIMQIPRRSSEYRRVDNPQSQVSNRLEIQNNMIKVINFNKIPVSMVLKYLQDNPNVSLSSRVCIALLQKIGKERQKIKLE